MVCTYAVTSHSAQSLTAERVLVNADTGVHPDLLNSRFGDVSVSRASHEVTIFTDNVAKLNPQLSADISKTSALEISQSIGLAQQPVAADKLSKPLTNTANLGGAKHSIAEAIVEEIGLHL
jgi:hypothetical protein